MESKAHKQAAEIRRAVAETRKQELHQWAVLLAEAKVDREQALTSNARESQIGASTHEKEIPLAQKAA